MLHVPYIKSIGFPLAIRQQKRLWFQPTGLAKYAGTCQDCFVCGFGPQIYGCAAMMACPAYSLLNRLHGDGDALNKDVLMFQSFLWVTAPVVITCKSICISLHLFIMKASEPSKANTVSVCRHQLIICEHAM